MTKLAFLVNGDENSPMGFRARAFVEHLRADYEIELAYREGNKIAALFRFFRMLRQLRPDVTYVFDMAYSGVLAAWFYRLFFGNRLIIETGDAIYELMRSTGNRGRVGLALTRWFEKFSFRTADRIVVRGRLHQEWLARRGLASDVVQDGVDTNEFKPLDTVDLRREHKLDDVLTVGLVGSSIWSDKLQMCYGWELVELLRVLKDEPVKGVLIGDGSGIPQLRARCKEYGIEEKVLFLGYVPHKQLPRYLNLIDVCLSTQTNDLVGQVRTSGKLPLYLAAGRYVLASEVGEASFVLKPEMLVTYAGVKDEEYPQRLAKRVQAILAAGQDPRHSSANVAIAKEIFDYSKLAARLSRIINGAITSSGGNGRRAA